jgi:hypothetical protein
MTGDCPKCHHSFAFRLHGLEYDPIDPLDCVMEFQEVRNFIFANGDSGITLILSTEGFMVLHPWSLKVLFGRFLVNYDVTVVYYYRFWINRVYSIFNQEARNVDLNTINIGKFFFHEWLAKYEIPFISDRAILAKWSEAMGGSDNITVVDYYGALKRGLSAQQVFACDILKICGGATGPQFETIAKVNEATSLIDQQLYAIFAHLTKAVLHCHMSLLPSVYLGKIVELLGEMRREVPMTTRTPSPSWMNFSLAIDRDVRQKYRVVYGDVAENERRARDFAYQEVSRQGVVTSKWRDDLREIFFHFYDNGGINCSQAISEQDWAAMGGSAHVAHFKKTPRAAPPSKKSRQNKKKKSGGAAVLQPDEMPQDFDIVDGVNN